LYVVPYDAVALSSVLPLLLLLAAAAASLLLLGRFNAT
jgi:hypothetical protein